MLQAIGLLAAFLSLFAAADFIKQVATGEARVERSASMIWVVTTSVIFVTNVAEGAKASLWLAGADALVALVIFGLSLKFGYGWVKGRDTAGFVVAMVGVVVWQLTKDPTIALVSAISVDFIGSYLVLVKSYEAPKTEPARPWVIYAISAVLAGISVGTLDVEVLIFPFYAAISSLAIVFANRLGVKKGN